MRMSLVWMRMGGMYPMIMMAFWALVMVFALGRHVVEADDKAAADLSIYPMDVCVTLGFTTALWCILDFTADLPRRDVRDIIHFTLVCASLMFIWGSCFTVSSHHLLVRVMAASTTVAVFSLIRWLNLDVFSLIRWLWRRHDLRAPTFGSMHVSY